MADLRERLQRQLETVLDKMEEHPERYSSKERIALLTAGSMFLQRDVKLRAASESDSAGSSVRKYGTAFKTANVVGGREARKRSAKRPANGSAAPPDTSTSRAGAGNREPG